MSATVPLIEISGAPFARGCSYGRQARLRVQRGVENYKKSMEARGVTWQQACDAAASYFTEIAELEPDFAEELRGIAEGGEVPIEGVVIINARSEILHRFGTRYKDNADGCTGAIILPEMTTDGLLIHGQNWDWMLDARDTAVVLRVQDEGHEILTFVEAGGLARCGLNSAGIAVTGNSLLSSVPLPERSLPMSLIRRKVLEARNFTQALEAVYLSPRGCSNNMMISHCGGQAIDLETTPQEIFWLRPEHGILVHANHFRSAAALSKFVDTGVAKHPDTLAREGRLETLIRSKAGRIGITVLLGCFLDTWGKPDGILTLPQEEWSGVMIGTVATIVMVPARGEMFFCTSPDQRPDFLRVSLKTSVNDDSSHSTPSIRDYVGPEEICPKTRDFAPVAEEVVS